jgi:hypothetical protein
MFMRLIAPFPSHLDTVDRRALYSDPGGMAHRIDDHSRN